MDADGDGRITAVEWIQYLQEVKRLRGVEFLFYLLDYLTRVHHQQRTDLLQAAPDAHPSRYVIKKYAHVRSEYSIVDCIYRGEFGEVFNPNPKPNPNPNPNPNWRSLRWSMESPSQDVPSR